MSYEATDAVLKYSKAKGTERLVLLVIATHANPESGSAWPSIATLASETALGGRQVQALIRRLEATGELTIDQGQGRKNTNIYRVMCLERVLDPTGFIAQKKVQDPTEKVQDRVKRVLDSAEKVLDPAPEPKEPNTTKEEPKNTTAAQSTPRPAPVRSSKPKAEPKPIKDPTAFQLLFDALALTCYGGHDGLTAPASSRIGSAAKVLMAAGYTAPDAPLIAAWIGAQEKWRTGPLSPQTIAERAPAWKQGVKAGAGRMPKSNELDDQDWAEESRMADLRNSGIDLSPASSGWN